MFKLEAQDEVRFKFCFFPLKLHPKEQQSRTRLIPISKKSHFRYTLITNVYFLHVHKSRKHALLTEKGQAQIC